MFKFGAAFILFSSSKSTLERKLSNKEMTKWFGECQVYAKHPLKLARGGYCKKNEISSINNALLFVTGTISHI